VRASSCGIRRGTKRIQSVFIYKLRKAEAVDVANRSGCSSVFGMGGSSTHLTFSQQTRLGVRTTWTVDTLLDISRVTYVFIKSLGAPASGGCGVEFAIDR
jgi:hypothetical protein